MLLTAGARGEGQHSRGVARLGNLGFILQVADRVDLDWRDRILATGWRTDLREAELVAGGPDRKLQQQTETGCKELH